MHFAVVCCVAFSATTRVGAVAEDWSDDFDDIADKQPVCKDLFFSNLLYLALQIQPTFF